MRLTPLIWLWRGDPEGLERAKHADDRADDDLATSRRNGQAATRLLIENHLTERFFKEMRERFT